MVADLKRIIAAGLSGGVVLLVVTFIADAIAQVIAPYNLFELGGMREIQDPVMMLFFLEPFIFAIIVAIVWSIIKSSIKGSDIQRTLRYAGILFILVVVPNSFVIFSTMTYPVGFHISNILTGIISYPVIAYLNVRFN